MAWAAATTSAASCSASSSLSEAESVSDASLPNVAHAPQSGSILWRSLSADLPWAGVKGATIFFTPFFFWTGRLAREKSRCPGRLNFDWKHKTSNEGFLLREIADVVKFIILWVVVGWCRAKSFVRLGKLYNNDFHRSIRYLCPPGRRSATQGWAYQAIQMPAIKLLQNYRNVDVYEKLKAKWPRKVTPLLIRKKEEKKDKTYIYLKM